MYGSKADNLIRLRDDGINVPPFTVIPFDEVVDTELFEKEDLRDYSGKELRDYLRDDYDARIRRIVGEKTCRVSVRSSCSLEDGRQSSFAGQFATFLNVDSADILKEVVSCMESMFRKNVLAYMKERNISLQDAGSAGYTMSVIVQDMVDADRSGVLFTANPQGILNESVITVGRGLGDGVVTGSADTTTYYCQQADNLRYYEGKEDLLSDAEVEELMLLSGSLKDTFGEYLDIEFAYRDGELYILQVRPITTLSGEHPLILDNSNIVESYPGVSLPLTISFVDIVYTGVFRGVCRRILKNDRELAKSEDVFKNMVGHANGRIYYKISNWYTVLKYLPFHKKIIPLWQEMLGVKVKGYDTDEVDISAFTRAMTYVNSLYELFSAPRHMRSLEKEFDDVNRHFYEVYREDMSPKELIGLYNDIRERLLDIWDVTLVNDMYAFIYTGLVKKRLKKKLKKKHSGDESYVNNYISGISNIESMKPIKALVELALSKDELTDEEYEERKREYIRVYGDRNFEELKLESPTFRSDPKLLDERIESYRSDKEHLAQLRRDLLGTQKESDNEGALEDPITRFLGKRCAVGIAGRERSRLNRSRIFGMVRLIFSGLGRYYEKAGLLENAGDIYYLTVEEAFALAEDGTRRDMKGVVRVRREAYELYALLPAYNRLIFENDEFDKRHVGINSHKRMGSSDVLLGVPCSAGEFTGEALVIENPQDAVDVAGKILVTKMTDPGWVFLLASAGGLISEKGSLLSHTAIISREIGIPSIVGVDDLLDTVRTGDILRMDGNTGRIEIVRRN